MDQQGQHHVGAAPQSEDPGGGCPAVRQSFNLARFERVEGRSRRAASRPRDGPQDLPHAHPEKMKVNYYEILGVERSASDQEIRDRFRKLVVVDLHFFWVRMR